ncbi:preprotein translocase subunit YajC [Geodermatophilus maliterrae]|uniref:Preprotein translocase subunit YajC n=1 Tax=Geodermatophilus maliterrae TaxID=3162531 RepID=A0ABV3XK61_9ACTN
MELFPLLLLVLAFVALVVLPARARKRQQNQTQSALALGVPVTMAGGVYATVAGLDDPATIQVEIAPGVVVTYARQAVVQVRQPVVTGPVVDPAVDPVADEWPARDDRPGDGPPGKTL